MLLQKNSQSVIASAQGSDNSIGSRLQSRLLSDASQTDPFFNALASNNPMGMMGSSPVTPNDSASTVGYMNPNGLTNVTFDPTNAPFNAAGSQVKLPDNLLSSTKVLRANRSSADITLFRSVGIGTIVECRYNRRKLLTLLLTPILTRTPRNLLRM